MVITITLFNRPPLSLWLSINDDICPARFLYNKGIIDVEKSPAKLNFNNITVNRNYNAH